MVARFVLKYEMLFFSCLRRLVQTEVVLICETTQLARMLSTGIIVLIVLVVLCAVTGSIYTYLYMTRINPQCLRRLRGPPKQRGPYSDPGGSNMDDDTNASSSLTTSTHMFLFRKWQKLWRKKLKFATAISELLFLFYQHSYVCYYWIVSVYLKGCCTVYQMIKPTDSSFRSYIR